MSAAVSPETGKLLLGLMTLLGAGGFAQLVNILIKRKPELRQLDSATDRQVVDSAHALLEDMREDRDADREEVKELKDENRGLHVEIRQCRKDLQRAEFEQERLARELAEVRNDLLMAHRQIDGLRRRLDRATWTEELPRIPPDPPR